MEATFGLSTIGQIHVPISDVDRAVEFYRDRLGMRFLFGYPGMAFFDCDGVRLFLSAPEGVQRGRSTIYFTVPDIEAAVTALESRGVVFDDRPHVIHSTDAHDLWMAFLRDPDGNLLGLMTEVAKA